MDNKGLFRQAALEKLASPERLDVLMQITSPAAWIILSAVGGALLLGLIWSFVGTIPIKVRGTGILLAEGGLTQVTSASPGRIEEIVVANGQNVREGDVIARLDQTDLRRELVRLQGLYSELERSEGSLDPIDAQNLRSEERRHHELRQLLESNAVTASQVDQSLARIAQIRERRAQRQQRIQEARRNVERQEDLLASHGEVRSAAAGRVVEIKKNRGDVIAQGEPLVTLEPPGKMEAVVFMPGGEGKKIIEGMKAQVSPATVRAEEWGFMIGQVRSVAPYAATPERMKTVIANDQEVQDLLKRGGRLETYVELTEDPATPSGYRWSSASGPPHRVSTGTHCEVSVTVEKKRPIEYILPIFRRGVGAS